MSDTFETFFFFFPLSSTRFLIVDFLAQMFEAEQNGGVTEEELECILHTALGVTELRVSRLFRAVDVANSGKVTFGTKTGSVTASGSAVRVFRGARCVLLQGLELRKRAPNPSGRSKLMLASLICF